MREQRSQELWQQIGEVWHLSLPAILTQITTIAMQYIDSAMVGAPGRSNASAAIGLVATTTWLFGGITYAIAAGFPYRSHIILEGKRERSQTGGMPWSAGCTSGIRNFVSDRTFHQRKTAGVAGR